MSALAVQIVKDAFDTIIDAMRGATDLSIEELVEMRKTFQAALNICDKYIDKETEGEMRCVLFVSGYMENKTMSLPVSRTTVDIVVSDPEYLGSLPVMIEHYFIELRRDGQFIAVMQ